MISHANDSHIRRTDLYTMVYQLPDEQRLATGRLVYALACGMSGDAIMPLILDELSTATRAKKLQFLEWLRADPGDARGILQ